MRPTRTLTRTLTPAPTLARCALCHAVVRPNLDPNPNPNPNPNPDQVRSATLSCGDVAMYDASVLHFGGANRVPGNTRVIWYIGAARKGEAARVAAGAATATSGLQAVPAIPLKSFL